MDISNTDRQKQQLLIETLEKSSDEKVMSMLIDLKEYGELFYLNSLLNMLLSNRSEQLKKGLVEFISDIKLQAAAPIIANCVDIHKSSPYIILLITASWQSRLDFSAHLSTFFQILIDSDYKSAFEAFTVIENNIDGLTPDELTEHIALVRKGINKTDRDKQLLLLEMISVLDKTRRAAE